jgi:hypothetical protein
MSLLQDMSVRTKLVALFTLFAIIPTTAMYGVFYAEKSDVSGMATSVVTDQTTTINELIDRNLFERYGDVQAFGYNTVAYDSSHWGKPGVSNPLVMAMNQYTKAYGFYPLMMLVGTDGKVLGVNTIAADGKALDTKPLYDENFKDAQWFKDAIDGKFLSGKNGFTGTAIQPPAHNELIAKAYGVGSNDGYSFALSAPVKNGEGKLIGVWVNFADMKLVDDIIGDMRKQMVAKGWEKADMMLIDRSGTILVDYDPQNFDDHGNLKHDFNNLLKKNLVGIGLKSAAEAVKGKSGTLTEYSPDSKTTQVFGYNFSDGAYDFPGLSWSMVIGVDESEVYKNVYTIENEMIYGGIICFGLAILCGFLVGGAAAKPLQDTTAIMLKLADGDLHVHIPTAHGKDELNAITRSLQVFKDNGIRVDALQSEQIKRETEGKINQRKIMLDLADSFESSIGHIVSIHRAASQC